MSKLLLSGLPSSTANKTQFLLHAKQYLSFTINRVFLWVVFYDWNIMYNQLLHRSYFVLERTINCSSSECWICLWVLTLELLHLCFLLQIWSQNILLLMPDIKEGKAVEGWQHILTGKGKGFETWLCSTWQKYDLMSLHCSFICLYLQSQSSKYFYTSPWLSVDLPGS